MSVCCVVFSWQCYWCKSKNNGIMGRHSSQVKALALAWKVHSVVSPQTEQTAQPSGSINTIAWNHDDNVWFQATTRRGTPCMHIVGHFQRRYYPETNSIKLILSYKHVWFLVPILSNLSVFVTCNTNMVPTCWYSKWRMLGLKVWERGNVYNGFQVANDGSYSTIHSSMHSAV